MPSKNPSKPRVHSLHCTACDAEKASIMMELCPTCEQAMLRHFPIDYFAGSRKEEFSSCAIDVVLDS